MADIRPIAEEVASLCPPVGKALAYGRVYVIRIPNEGIRMIFSSDEKGPDGNPRLHTWLGWTSPVKAKMGGRIDNLNGYYLIVAGGKKAAKRIADALNS
jgi:hypothetical protein